MNKSKVRGLKWNMEKLRGLILLFTLKKTLNDMDHIKCEIEVLVVWICQLWIVIENWQDHNFCNNLSMWQVVNGGVKVMGP